MLLLSAWTISQNLFSLHLVLLAITRITSGLVDGSSHPWTQDTGTIHIGETEYLKNTFIISQWHKRMLELVIMHWLGFIFKNNVKKLNGDYVWLIQVLGVFYGAFSGILCVGLPFWSCISEFITKEESLYRGQHRRLVLRGWHCLDVFRCLHRPKNTASCPWT